MRAAAVVYPADCSAEEIHVTYTFADGSVYTETKTGRNFEAGRIYRLTTEITKRDGGSLEIQGLEDSDEPVCMKYGASEAYALTAGGWIPTVEMTSAPAGWTADFDIARRSLLIAPPAEYTDGMDLENTVTIQSDDKPILSQEYYVLDFTHPEGTFVLIEGNMTSENGTIVYFDQHMRYHEKVYEEINDNEIGNVGAKSANSEKISYICRLKQSVFARQTAKRRILSSDRVRENGTKNFIYVGKQTQNRHHAG